jgi:hypothetical protein
MRAALVERELLPDLETLTPTQVDVVGAGADRRLRFTNAIANRGPGALEVRPGSDRADRRCRTREGRRKVQAASQRVYGDADSNGRFEREVDVASRRANVGCMLFHRAHDHWHVEAFARYTLRSRQTGVVAARASKVSFCLRDSRRPYASAPGSPSRWYYGECTRSSVQGISVGWSDVYTYDLPDQDLDIAGLPDGLYCLVSRANPGKRLQEVTRSNNTARLGLRLSADSVAIDPAGC